MLEKLASLEARYNELTEEIAKPEVIADQTTWQKLMKAHADLEPVVETYRAYKAALEAVDEAKGILEEEKDAELRELAQMQLDEQREETTTKNFAVAQGPQRRQKRNFRNQSRHRRR